MAELDIIKPTFPPHGATLGEYWPYLASIELTEESLYAACIKLAKVVGISTDLQKVKLLYDGTEYPDVPVWIHTDIGARAHLMRGQDVDAPNYFKDGGLLFPLPECVPIQWDVTEDAWTLPQIMWRHRAEDDTVVFNPAYFNIRAIGGSSIISENVWAYEGNLAVIKPDRVVVEEFGLLVGGVLLYPFEYTVVDDEIKVIVESISWYHTQDATHYHIPIECVTSTDGSDLVLCPTVFHARRFRLNEFKTTPEEWDITLPPGHPGFDYTKHDVAIKVWLYRKISYPPMVFTLMLPDINEVPQIVAVIGIERNIGRKATDVTIEDQKNGVTYHNVNQFAWPTYRPYGVAFFECWIYDPDPELDDYQVITHVYRDLLTGNYIRIPEYDENGVPLTPISTIDLVDIADIFDPLLEPREQDLMGFHSNGGQLGSMYFQDPGLSEFPKEPSQYHANYNRQRFGESCNFDFFDDMRGGVDPYWRMQEHLYLPESFFPQSSILWGWYACCEFEHPSVRFTVANLLDDDHFAVHRDEPNVGWFDGGGTITPIGTDGVRREYDVFGGLIEVDLDQYAASYNSTNTVNLPVCFTGSLSNQVFNDANRSGFSERRTYVSHSGLVIDIENVISFVGSGLTSGVITRVENGVSLWDRDTDASATEKYTFRWSVDGIVQDTFVVDFDWIKFEDINYYTTYYYEHESKWVGKWHGETYQKEIFRHGTWLGGGQNIEVSHHYPCFLYDIMAVYTVLYAKIEEQTETGVVDGDYTYSETKTLVVKGKSFKLVGPNSMVQHSAVDHLELLCPLFAAKVEPILYSIDIFGLQNYDLHVYDWVFLMEYDPRIPLE